MFCIPRRAISPEFVKHWSSGALEAATMTKSATASAIALIAAALSAPLAAQWLNHPTPGIPRTADGKPNLAAPAPRTPDGKPDLSGLWNKISPKYSRNIAADLKPGEIQPWAQALVQQRREDLGKDYMNVQCVPLGPGYTTSADSTGAEMMKIVQTPGAHHHSQPRSHLSPDFPRRPRTGNRPQSELDGILGRAIGTATRWSWRVSDSMTAPGSITMAIPTPKRCA